MPSVTCLESSAVVSTEDARARRDAPVWPNEPAHAHEVETILVLPTTVSLAAAPAAINIKDCIPRQYSRTAVTCRTRETRLANNLDLQLENSQSKLPVHKIQQINVVTLLAHLYHGIHACGIWHAYNYKAET